MAGTMKDIDIRDFETVSSVDDFDHVVLSLFGGRAGKMTVALLRTILTKGITPSIGEDGNWYVGESDTGVVAEGKTPEFRNGENSIEFKYTTEDDSMWRLFVSYTDLRLRYEDLSEEQLDSLKLKYEDLSEEEIKELQQPANDMIDMLKQTDDLVRGNEEVREEAESLRASEEESRKQAETERKQEWEKREEQFELMEEAENARSIAEEERETNESVRRLSEDLRTENEYRREREFSEMMGKLVTESSILVLSEKEYEDAENSGAIDETKLYFAYEEE